MKKVENWDNYGDVMMDTDKYVRYGDDDKPNKYGYTKKMLDILDIVDGEKDPDKADFDWDDASLMYYWFNQNEYLDAKKEHGGKKPVIVHYIND